jgi:hypothetical protein
MFVDTACSAMSEMLAMIVDMFDFRLSTLRALLQYVLTLM